MKKIWLRSTAVAAAAMLTIGILMFWVLPYGVAHTSLLSRLLSSRLGATVQVDQPRFLWQGYHFQLQAKKITLLAKPGSTHPAASWEDVQLGMLQWGKPNLSWRKARIVVGFDADNHPLLGDPKDPVVFKQASGSAVGAIFLPDIALSWQDTQIQLIKNNKQQTRLHVRLKKDDDSWRLQWKLADQTVWQQAAMQQSDGHRQLTIHVEHFDLSPLWRVFSERNTQMGASHLQLHANWQQKNGVWQGGWQDFSFQAHWKNQRENDLRVSSGSAQLINQGSTLALAMHWPSLQINDQVVRDISSSWQYQGTGSHPGWQWQAEEIKLAKWVPVLRAVLNTNQRQQWQAIAPKGVLDLLKLSVSGGKKPAIQLTAKFHGWQWNSYQNLPGIKGLSGDGVYNLNQKTARISLQTQDGSFSWPSQFPKAWQHIQFSSHLYLTKALNGWQLFFTRFDYHDPHLQANVKGNILLPTASAAAQFDWKMKFSVPDTRYVKYYLPKSMVKSTRQWLSQALQGGSINGAEMVWQGPADKLPFAHQEGVWRLSIPVEDLLLNYHSHWPYLRHAYGTATMDNAALRFQVTQAELMGNHALNGSGDILDVYHPVLRLQADFHTVLPAIKTFISATPLPWRYGLKPLDLNGPAYLSIQFSDDMEQQKQQISGALKLKGDRVSLPAVGVNLTQIDGDIHFTEKGLVGKKIAAKVQGLPVMLDLTLQPQQESALLTIDATGQLATKHWQQNSMPALDYLQGKTEYQAKLVYDGIPWSNNNKLTVDSTLQGLGVDLPYPLGKEKNVTLPTHLQLDLTPGKLPQLSFQYGKKAEGLFQFQQKNNKTTLRKGAIHIGPNEPVWPEEPGLTLIGLVDQLDGKRWAPVISELSTHSQQGSSYHWSAAHLEISHFLWGNTSLSRAYLSAHPDQGSWLFDLTSDYGLMNLRIPKDPKQKLALRFENFDWKPLFQKSKGNIDTNSMKDNWPTIPSINVVCNECRYGEKYLGSVNGIYQEERDGRHELQSTWQYQGTELTSTATWGQSRRVEWKGTATINDLAVIENHLMDSKHVESGEGVVDFDLFWKGEPFDLTAKAITGSMAVDLRSVKFIHIPKEIQSGLNFVRVVNALDFAQALPIVGTVKDGFYASHIRFSGQWKNQMFDTSDFELDSPVLDVDAAGQVDFGRKKLDFQTGLRPQITGSLPTLATIAGGPVLGVFAYAVNKIIEPIVGKAAEHHYRVSGPFANLSMKKLNESEIDSVGGSHV